MADRDTSAVALLRMAYSAIFEAFMSMLGPTLIVANPQSAGGSLGKRWPALAPALAEHFGPFEHRLTTARGEAPAIVRRALGEGFRRIIALGGDGTISEVVDGFFGPKGAAIAPGSVLAVIPFGTGGDFRRSVGLPKEIEKAARSIAQGPIRDLDVGRLTYITPGGQTAHRHFVNIASFGISGLVSAYVNRGSKRLGGRLSFALATLRAMRHYRPQRVRLRLDDGPTQEIDLHVTAVCNGQYFGGGMWMAPTARLDDGLFDIVTLAPMTLLTLLRQGQRVYKGTHLALPQTTFARAKRVVAEPSDPHEAILLDVDGETPGRLPATFEMLPAALRLQHPRPEGSS